MKELLIIDTIVGARPNFVKIAALFAVRREFPSLRLRLIHTGQHYDPLLSDIFFTQLSLPQPEKNLGVSSGSLTEQTAQIMLRYEEWVRASRPGLCLVVGDVTSTLACALVASRQGIPLAHVEAGLRSFDRSMPEEINRVVTDQLSALLFATEPAAVENLLKEGIARKTVHLVGNVMIDTLLRMRPQAEKLEARRRYGLEPRSYAFATLHRAANVDSRENLSKFCEELKWLAGQMPAIFAVHPRTRKMLQEFSLDETLREVPGLHLCEPLPYIEALSLVMEARLVVTDSGGLQEETTALGIPCLTLRENTERLITVEQGTSTLIGNDWGLFHRKVKEIAAQQERPPSSRIENWDGNAARRILKILSEAGL